MLTVGTAGSAAGVEVAGHAPDAPPVDATSGPVPETVGNGDPSGAVKAELLAIGKTTLTAPLGELETVTDTVLVLLRQAEPDTRVIDGRWVGGMALTVAVVGASTAGWES